MDWDKPIPECELTLKALHDSGGVDKSNPAASRVRWLSGAAGELIRVSFPPENPNKPLTTFQYTMPLSCLEYSPKDLHSLASGLFSGQVAIWDVRKGGEPVEVSVLESSHRDPVHDCLWLNSKSGTEFFTSSMDGQVGVRRNVARF